jgi:RNA polymerase sigma-70 factor, ECF subfamily
VTARRAAAYTGMMRAVTMPSDATGERPPAPARPAGSAPTFAEVAEAHLDTVFRYLLHLVGDRHLAEDLTAATFERALRRFRRYDPRRGGPAVWLCAIARTVALDHLRADARRRRREAAYAADADAETPEPLAGLSPALGAALARLTRAEREVVALRVVLELSAPEAARVLGVSTSACTSLLHRALTKLRREVTA